PAFAVGGGDLVGGDAEGELVGRAAYLLEGGIDQLEGAACTSVRGVLRGVDPDGEELRVEVALLRGLVVEHAGAERVREVPLVVDEALRRVCVGIDDDGLRVDLEGFL